MTKATMYLVGYEPVTEEGFTNPLFSKRKRGNFLYRADTQIDENYVIRITGFEEIEATTNFYPLSPNQVCSCKIGDEWIDIFIWNGLTYVGIKENLFRQLEPFHSEISEAYPLSFLDLVEGVDKATEEKTLRQAHDYLEQKFSSKYAVNWIAATYKRRKYINAYKVALIKKGASQADINALRHIKVNSNNGTVHVSVPLEPYKNNDTITEAVRKEYADIFDGEYTLAYEHELTSIWEILAEAHANEEPVLGNIEKKVKGGFAVDLGGINAFLPGSQVDIRPVRDVEPLMNEELPFMILKMNRSRGNIVVSRRAILEEIRAEQRAELVGYLEEGEDREGVVKNLTDYGAFVDLGGIDGLLHVTDMSWGRVTHPSQILSIGDTIMVKIIRINPETQRISLGMKQLQEDPWTVASAKYTVGSRHAGTVTNIADYGAFIELEEGVEGLVHVSEMSWTKNNVHPGKIVSTSETVEVEVLEVDEEKRRISLGMKQRQDNPWDSISERYPVGSIIRGEVVAIMEFGLFVNLEDDIDGMVHISDLSWERSSEEALTEYKMGQDVVAKILEVDTEKERVSLGIKQAMKEISPTKLKHGDYVNCTVTQVNVDGISVSFGDDNQHPGFIERSELSDEKGLQRPEQFFVGDIVEAKISKVDKFSLRHLLSIRLRKREELMEFGTDGRSQTNVTLGEILGEALKKER